LLAIDIFSGECYFRACKQAKSEDVAHYFAHIATLYQQQGFEKIEVFLDRNPTHKTKMQTLFSQLTAHLPMQVNFHLMPAYSPKLNLVEYAIHLIRQRVLHHADCKTSLTEFESYIEGLCEQGKVVTKEQIINILEHIESLIPNL
jgi:hypothetical protein